nr:MAG TPA: hypothetical protein [Caudoviricetes sp.]
MFEKLTNIITPFALSLIVIAGLALIGYLPVAERSILGYATIFAASLLIVAHVTKELKKK